MTIVRAEWYESGALRRIEYFRDLEIAHNHVRDWEVTDWGTVHYDEIAVTT